MPELPELQVASKNLQQMFSGKKLKRIKVVKGKKLKNTEAQFRKELEGKKLVRVYREGKELRMVFGDIVVGLHLMLHGELKTFDKKNENKFTIVEFYFDDDTGLALTDWQAQANLWLRPEENEVPDALSKEVNFKFLKEALQSKAKIKTVLTEQKTIRGIGNAYADEILWKAGISPFSVAKCIPDEKIKALLKSIRSVLTNAEKQILKAEPRFISGEIRDFLKVHNSKKETTPGGKKIKSEKVGGRKTYYTDEQKIYNCS